MKKISEVPEETLKTLYNARLIDHKNIPFEEYILRYEFIVVDNELYGDSNSWRVKMYNKAKSIHDIRSLLAYPDAVITNDNHIVKNRYGGY